MVHKERKGGRGPVEQVGGRRPPVVRLQDRLDIHRGGRLYPGVLDHEVAAIQREPEAERVRISNQDVEQECAVKSQGWEDASIPAVQ